MSAQPTPAPPSAAYIYCVECGRRIHPDVHAAGKGHGPHAKRRKPKKARRE